MYCNTIRSPDTTPVAIGMQQIAIGMRKVEIGTWTLSSIVVADMKENSKQLVVLISKQFKALY
jgi:hypothetical protein